MPAEGGRREDIMGLPNIPSSDYFVVRPSVRLSVGFSEAALDRAN